MARWLKALAEDLDLIPRAPVVAHNHLQLQMVVQESCLPLLGLLGTRHMCST